MLFLIELFMGLPYGSAGNWSPYGHESPANIKVSPDKKLPKMIQ